MFYGGHVRTPPSPYAFNPAQEKSKWEAYLDGTAGRNHAIEEKHNANVRKGMIALAVLVAAAVVGAIIALAVVQGMVPMKIPVAVFIPVPIGIGFVSGMLIGFAFLAHDAPPLPPEKNTLSAEGSVDKKEMELLFTLGDLKDLNNYFLKYRLDDLVYQKKIEPEQGQQMLELIQNVAHFAQTTPLFQTTQMVEYQLQWNNLRQTVCTKLGLEMKEAIRIAG